MKKTRGNEPYQTSIKSIISYGRKDVNMAQVQSKTHNFKEILKEYLILFRNWAFYAGIAYIAIKFLSQWRISVSISNF